MRRTLWLSVVALVVVGALGATASAQTTDVFKAEFRDGAPCPAGIDLCGKGHVQGFGTVTTSLVFTSLAPGPGANCVHGTANRVVTLDRDGSRLVLELAGTICGRQVDATFVIVAGDGAFAGASGGGTFWGITDEIVHYRGTITLS